MTPSKILALTLGSATLAGASLAQVSAFRYTAAPPNGSDSAGRIAGIDTTYDAAKQELAWKADFTSADGKLPDAFWLVVSDGPNPLGVSGQLAIFYFDATVASAPKLTAYGYNGENGSSSYKDGSPAPGTQAPDRIASSLLSPTFARELTVSDANGVRTLGFRADVSGVNAYTPQNAGGALWEGARFGAEMGVWFHALSGTTTSYENGYLKSFDSPTTSFYDDERLKTTPVPEPATLAAIGVGVVGLLRRRKGRAGGRSA